MIPSEAGTLVGFSMGGGSIPCRVPATNPKAVAALVPYYAAEVDQVRAINCPVLCHAAEVDDPLPGDDPIAFVSSLRSQGLDAQLISHQGTQAFLRKC